MPAAPYTPWNQKLAHPKVLMHPRQAWVEDTDFDIDYHIRSTAVLTPVRRARSPIVNVAPADSGRSGACADGVVWSMLTS